MPYKTEWIEPEILTEYNGVTVYYVYKDNDYEQARENWFTTDKEAANEGEGDQDYVYDARVLAEQLKMERSIRCGADELFGNMRRVFWAAIDKGLVKMPEKENK